MFHIRGPATFLPPKVVPIRSVRAGGPGSGCHGDNCGRPSTGGRLELPVGVGKGVVKGLPLHSTWIKHKNWKNQAYGGVIVNDKGQYLLREPAGHFDGYAWTWPKGKMDNEHEHPADVASREVQQETGFNVKFFGSLPGTYTSGSGSYNSFYLMRPDGHNANQMDDETRGLKWASYSEAKRLIGETKNKSGRKRDLVILERAHVRIQKRYRVDASIEAGGPGSGCHGPNCGRPPLGKKDVGKYLKEQGWKPGGKLPVPGKEGLKTGSKPVYTHPSHGTVWVGSKNFYHQPLNGKVTHGKMEKLTPHLSQSIGVKHGDPSVGKSAIVDKTYKPNSPSALGLVDQYKSKNTGNIWKYNQALGMYYQYKTSGIITSQPPKTVTQLKAFVVKGLFVPHAETLPTPREKTPREKVNPAEGLATEYKSSTSDTTWKKDNYTGLYVPYKGDGTKSPSQPQKAETIKLWQDQGLLIDKKVVSKEPEETKPVKAPEKSTIAIPSSPTPQGLTYKESGKALGGAHDKHVFTDKDGVNWLFKPATTLDGKPDPIKAYAEVAAARIQEALRPGFAATAALTHLEINGKTEFGSVQKMVPKEVLRGPDGKYKDFVGRDIASLQPWEVAQLQHEQVVDWLVSNHDGHEGQFLRVSSGYPGGRGVIGIDKAQAFRYFPGDSLSMTYQPNTAKYGEKPPIYNAMWKAAKDGKFAFDPNNTLEAIKKAEGISDNDYKSMLRPYAEARFPDEKTNIDDFLQAATDRKNNLRADFEKFFSEVTGNKFKFDAAPTGAGVVNIPYPYSTNPDPDFSQKVPSRIAELGTSVKTWFAERGIKKDDLASSFGSFSKDKHKVNFQELDISQWKDKVDSGMSPVEAAAQHGLYAQLAAEHGIAPKDLMDVQKSWKSWSGSTTGGSAESKVAEVRKAAQEVTSGKCCSSKLAAAVELEHVITRAKLQLLHPDGYVNLNRALSGNVATQIIQNIKKHEVLTIKMLNAEGWSDHNGWSGDVRLTQDTSVDHIVSSYKTNPEAWGAHMGEHEYAVAFPGIWTKDAAPGSQPGVYRQFKTSEIKVGH